MNLVFRNHIEIRSRHAACLVSPEDFPGTQGSGSDAFGDGHLQAPGFSLLNSVPNLELALFQQRNETTSKAEKVRSSDHECLQKMIEIAAGTQFGGDLEQLMQFMCLGMSGGMKFRSAADKATGELGQAQCSVDFTS